MTVEYWNGIPIIDDNTDADMLFAPQYARGAEPRDYAVDPPEMFDAPSAMQLIPRSEWDARIDEQEATQSSLWHLYQRNKFPLLQQGSFGYCWAHSTTHAVMFSRLTNSSAPVVPLSAFAVAATIKQGRNEGGWCGLSAKFAREKGIPSQAMWPQGRADYRTFDKSEVWADAAKHKVTEDWYDLTRPVHGQLLSDEQMATCLLSNTPACHDNLGGWQHSVCAVRLVRIEAGRYGYQIANSWGPSWGEQGFGILAIGSRYGKIDGAVAIRSTSLWGGVI